MMSGGKICRKLFSVFTGAVIASILFLFIPLSLHPFQKKIKTIADAGSEKLSAAETVSFAEPQRKHKKTLKPVLNETEKQKFSMDSLLSPDLSLLSETAGSGDAAAGEVSVMDESEADTPPVKRITVPPVYPSAARDRGVEGLVVARILIGEDGTVQQVVILEAPSGYGFDRAVIRALMKWKFEPARLHNMPVSVWARQEIRFSL